MAREVFSFLGECVVAAFGLVLMTAIVLTCVFGLFFVAFLLDTYVF